MKTLSSQDHRMANPWALCTWIALSAWGAACAESGLDTFGITRMLPSKTGTREWTSAHWANGQARTLKYSPDPYDPTGWTDDHSGSTDGFRIDGQGTMTMSGGGPRFHINSTIATKVPSQLFLNTEFTAYYMRKGAGGAAWGGMIVGARSGPLGHASSGGNDCDATTYYGRFRNDGKWDVEKELKHPGSTYWSGSGFGSQDPLWHGKTLPQNRWIGMKYLAYNIDSNTQVKLELYIDSVSNGVPVAGGHWEKVGEVVDDGNWPSADVSGCGYDQKMIINPGHGTFLWRTDNDTAVYKMVSIREIDPSQVATTLPRPRSSQHRLRALWRANIARIELDGNLVESTRVIWFGLDGQKLTSPKSQGLVVASLASGHGQVTEIVSLERISSGP